jgi:putative RecB family exonuclease
MTIYSHSSLNTYENCPLQYKLSRIDKIKRDEEGVEAFLGSRFHETMERLYKDVKFKTPTLSELIEYYYDRWNKEWNDGVVITNKERTAEDYKNLGRKSIEDYYRRYQPFNQARILGLEKEILFDLSGDGKYKFRGIIDRIAQTEDGTYEIHDYKTSGHLPSQKDLDENRQLGIYEVALRSLWNDVKSVKLIWHFVVFDKEFVSTRTQEQLEELKSDTVKLIDQLENTKEFLPRESALCNWCPYPDLCPKKKHLYKIETLPANEYLNDDGVKLVNTFAGFVSQKKNHQEEIKKLDEEIDKVKEAVIVYGEREKIDVINGSDNKLKINKKQKISSPTKGSPERKELENILRQAGKWDEVCDLDIYAIEKIVNEGRWDKDITDKVKPFLEFETRTSVSLSKLRDRD